MVEWLIRQDPFSSFRSGFEIRTYRLCRRVLMFHNLADQLGAPARLVRATELTYDEKPTVTYLTSVRAVGYSWSPGGTVSTAAMPSIPTMPRIMSQKGRPLRRLSPGSICKLFNFSILMV